MTVEPGETFEVVTQMNRGPDLAAVPEELLSLWSRYHSYDVKRPNPSSGAIRIRGAEPGMAINIFIEDVDLAPVGWTGFWGSNRLFPAFSGDPSRLASSRVVRIEGGYVVWDDDLLLPTRPMVGLVAVAPAHEAQSTVRVGPWGGNLDIQEVGPGSQISLPVNVPGALLHVGDVHALQGDGEIAGSGVETAAVIRLRVELEDRPNGMAWPRVLTRGMMMVVGSDGSAETALRIAVDELISWIHYDYGLDRSDALLLLGQVMQARVTQAVNPTITYVAGIGRDLL